MSDDRGLQQHQKPQVAISTINHHQQVSTILMVCCLVPCLHLQSMLPHQPVVLLFTLMVAVQRMDDVVLELVLESTGGPGHSE